VRKPLRFLGILASPVERNCIFFLGVEKDVERAKELCFEGQRADPKVPEVNSDEIGGGRKWEEGSW
jgi:hypothetical protein